MSHIEFRVHGVNAREVAEQFDLELRKRFKVDTKIEAQPPSAPAPGAKFDVDQVIAVIALLWNFFNDLVRQPEKERRVALSRHCGELIAWAQAKLPTTILVVGGNYSKLLHEANAESFAQIILSATRDGTVTVRSEHQS
jgi:hypothetical protein